MLTSPMKPLAFVIGSLFVIYTPVTLARSLSGAGDSAVVDRGDTPEDWTVSNRADLTINADGVTNAITLSSAGVLTATGATVNGLLLVGESSATISGSTLTNTSGGALRLTDTLATPLSNRVAVSNSILSGAGYGASLVGNSELSLSNTRVSATTTGSTSLTLGNAIRHFGGILNITNGSSISGAANGIDIRVDQDGLSGTPDPSLTASVLIDNSVVSGASGSAISVGRNSAADNTTATIEVNNGSVLNGGNGNILSVAEGSTVTMLVNNSQLTGNVMNEVGSTTDLTLNNGASITGAFNNVTGVTLDGTSVWNVTQDSSVGVLNNNGTVAFSDGSSGRTLTVNGDYVGNNGTLIFNTVLGDDSSLTDKLVVAGNTSGDTHVQVNNLGGSGSQTLNGIALISVQGNSDGTFTQQGRIVAGAYDYHLQRGAGSNASNWYLSSENNDENGDGGDHGGATPPAERILRPEAGSYIANLRAANQMFVMSMNDRLSAMQGADSNALWLRNSGGHTREHDVSGQLETQTNGYALQLGSDLAQLTATGQDRLNVGVMTGYGYSTSNTDSTITRYRSSGTVHGYSLGIYGNWFANADKKTGLYADGWAQYSWFDNSVQGDGLAAERYHAKGMTTSLEAGYIMPLLNATSVNVYLQPKGQLIWMGVKADDHREANGTRISATGNDNLQSRIGVRTYADFHTVGNSQNSRSLRPFAEVNWIHNTQNYGARMDDVTVGAAGSRNLSEVSVGLEGDLNAKLAMSGNVAQRTGTNSYSDTALGLNIKYRF